MRNYFYASTMTLIGWLVGRSGHVHYLESDATAAASRVTFSLSNSYSAYLYDLQHRSILRRYLGHTRKVRIYAHTHISIICNRE
jgi:hypothetical protein